MQSLTFCSHHIKVQLRAMVAGHQQLLIPSHPLTVTADTKNSLLLLLTVPSLSALMPGQKDWHCFLFGATDLLSHEGYERHVKQSCFYSVINMIVFSFIIHVLHH